MDTTTNASTVVQPHEAPEPNPSVRPPLVGLPPGPSSSTIVQTWRFVRNPLPLLTECAQRFGDLFTIHMLGTGPWVYVCSPPLLRTMFTAPPDVVCAGAANASIFGPLAGPGTVLTMDASPHLARRRLLLPQFHGDRMQVYFEQMRDSTLATMNKWQVGVPFALHRDLQDIALQTIMRGVFGIKAEDGNPGERALRAALIDFATRAVNSPLIFMPALQRDLGTWSPWGRVLHFVHRADDAVLGEVARRRASAALEGRQDILSLLLDTRCEDGSSLSDSELRDELMVMLVAGHETTGTALAWACERILSLPAVEERLRAELDSVLAGQPLSAAALPRLEYLDAVVKESLRIRPVMPAGGARLLRRPLQIGRYLIPAGATLINCMYVLHRRPDLYPDPDAFVPERFLGKRVIDPYEWTPFGGGIRRCLGLSFALFEMKTVLATLLSRVRLRIENPNARVVRRGFFLAPEHGPRVSLVSRAG